MTAHCSLVINAKNEEKDIVECIRSAKELVSEVIVADMKSTDRTVELAKSVGATVFSVKDTGYVEPARNEAIQRASNEWVLLLDADERLSPKLCERLAEIASNDSADVVEIPFKTIILGKWMQHTKWWPVHLKRFFKKRNVSWPSTIHATPTYTGRIQRLEADEKLCIVHYNFHSVEEIALKFLSYAKHEHNVTKKELNNPRDFLQYIESGFYERFIEFEGYKDKLHGFFLSKLIEFYKLMEMAYAWEKNNYDDTIETIDLLNIIRHEKNTEIEWENEVFKKKNEELNKDLFKIKSSKFYKVWQRYCELRDTVKSKVNGNK